MRIENLIKIYSIMKNVIKNKSVTLTASGQERADLSAFEDADSVKKTNTLWTLTGLKTLTPSVQEHADLSKTGSKTVTGSKTITGSKTMMSKTTSCFAIALLCALFFLPRMAQAQTNWTGTQTLTDGQTVSTPITLTGNVTINVASGMATISGVISSSSASYTVTKTGAGILILTGQNTYTGVTTVSAGTLSIGSNGATGHIAGNIQVNTGATLRFNRSGAYTYNGNITGAGNVEHFTTGSLTLGGANSTFSGTTTVYGTLILNSSIANSTVVLNQTNSRLEVPEFGSASIAAFGATVATSRISIGNLGSLAVGTIGSATGGGTFIGGLRGSGLFSKTGSATLTLNGDNYGFTGDVFISAGTVVLGADTHLNESQVTLEGATAKLNISSGYQAIAGLYATNAQAEVILGAQTLEIFSAENSTFSGVFSGVGGSVKKTGAGQFTLSGAANTATGTFTCSAGTTVLAGNWAGNFVKDAAATLTVTGSRNVGGQLTMQGGVTNFDLNAATPSRIVAASSLTASGTNTLHISAVGSAESYVLIQAASGVSTANFALSGATGVLSATAAALSFSKAPFEGAGTATDPFRIASAADLAQLATMMNSSATAAFYRTAHYIQGAYIDIGSYANWTPIGTQTLPFEGVYDGNGLTVANLKINQNTSFKGLFGYVNAAGAVVRNVRTSFVDITGAGGVGGVVGRLENGTVEYCRVSGGSITAIGDVGGITGHIGAGGTVQYCYVDVLTVTGNGNGNGGGIAGGNSGTVQNCYSTATVSGERAGGVASRNETGATIDRCYTTGAITGTGDLHVGGIVALNNGAVTRCVALNASVTGAVANMGRVTATSGGTLTNNFVRETGMTLPAGYTVNAGATLKDGANASAADTHGDNSVEWWSSSPLDFSASVWMFSANRLPVLQNFGGDVQNPTVSVPNAAPSFSAQPEDVAIAAGGDASFQAIANGTPVPSCQWQVSTDDGGTWTDVANGGIYSGATTSTLSLSNVPIEYDGYQYRCRATNTEGSDESNAATLTVGEKSVVLSEQNGTIIAGIEGEVTYAVVTENIAAGVVGTVQWFINFLGSVPSDPPAGISSTVSAVAADGTATVTITATAAAEAGTYYFRARIDGRYSLVANLVVSATVTKTVSAGAQNGTINAGAAGTATFPVTTENIANGATGSVTWYTTAAGTDATTPPTGVSASVSAVASNAATVTVTATASVQAGAHYFRVTIDDAQSEIATLTVGDKPTGTAELFAPDLKVFPNPFTDVIRIAGATGCTLRVMNAAGTVVHTQIITNPDENIRLEHLPQGAYLLMFEKEGKTKTVKAIKN